MKVDIISANAEHAAHIARYIRDSDRAEIMASSGLEPMEALNASMLWSSMIWTGRIDCEPVCIFGVGGPYLIGGLGIPWLIATDKVMTAKFQFLSLNKIYVRQMLGVYTVLKNYVDARNTDSIRWLEWIGFQIMDAEPFGYMELPFHPFEMRRSNV